MASKSKNVRIEQRRIFEKQLELRLKKLAGEGISKEKAQKDPLVKNLKSKIRETNVRIAASDKNSAKIQELAQAKEQKLAAALAPKVVAAATEAASEKESKPKKKAAVGEKEAKKKPEAAADGEAPKKARKKKEEPKEA